jgi:predicted ester cyclase
MSIEEQNMAVMRAALRAWNEGTVAAASAQFIAPEFVRHDLNGAWQNVAGPGGVADFSRMLSAALGELHLEVAEMVASGDRVVVRFVGSGIHQGELLGVPATGRRVTWNGINIYRRLDGKVVETWQLADHLGILRQMGAVSVAAS